ncbi:MAG: HNH endonuclease signature motif containing protein [Bdellovibrionota bacterium]
MIPVSQGGPNSIGNLTTLCSGHHKSVHAVT